jgi:hypothetical protein
LFTTKWLQNLGVKVDAVTQDMIDADEPPEQAEENDQILGEVPESLKRLRALSTKMTDDMDKQFEEHRKTHGLPGHSHQECEKFHEGLVPIKLEVEAIQQLFWLSLLTELGITFNKNLSLRHGWKVVLTPEEKEEEEEESGIPVGMTVLHIGHRHR